MKEQGGNCYRIGEVFRRVVGKEMWRLRIRLMKKGYRGCKGLAWGREEKLPIERVRMAVLV